mmetsp:Transcript_19898/g.37441  ORF Transcript_19898/g.37441 Transcript_19898/m.37441 type:complete len:82 (-) Transcript_19898:313-558(-)
MGCGGSKDTGANSSATSGGQQSRSAPQSGGGGAKGGGGGAYHDDDGRHDKMTSARTLKSDISMMSELTDLSGTVSNMSIGR